MKTIFTLRIIGITVALLTPAMVLAQNSPAKAGKVNVCHVTGNGTYRLININKNALPAHLDHGDAGPASLILVRSDGAAGLARPARPWSGADTSPPMPRC
ncbi:MAG: hypothetical protein LAQ30_23370 [Acidobacteriia bacterium]|nr:hypothetical protein [Terriglobia bacterium]